MSENNTETSHSLGLKLPYISTYFSFYLHIFAKYITLPVTENIINAFWKEDCGYAVHDTMTNISIIPRKRTRLFDNVSFPESSEMVKGFSYCYSNYWFHLIESRMYRLPEIAPETTLNNVSEWTEGENRWQAFSSFSMRNRRAKSESEHLEDFLQNNHRQQHCLKPGGYQRIMWVWFWNAFRLIRNATLHSAVISQHFHREHALKPAHNYWCRIIVCTWK